MRFATVGSVIAAITRIDFPHSHWSAWIPKTRWSKSAQGNRLGSIDPDFTEGFERSILSTIASGGGAEWWENAKPAFSASFVTYVDHQLATNTFSRIHPT